MAQIKFRFYFILLVLIGAVLFNSCSIEKRRFRDGYFISTKNERHIKKINLTKNNANQDSQKDELGLDFFMESKSILPLASTSDDISFLFLEKVNSTNASNINSTPQDSCAVIKLKDGSTISAIILEISSSQIRYKKCDRQNSPVYIIESSKVDKITYPDGSEDIIQNDNVNDEPINNQKQNYNASDSKNNKKDDSYSEKEHTKHIAGGIIALVLGIAFIIGGILCVLLFSMGVGIITILFGLIALIFSIIYLSKA